MRDNVFEDNGLSRYPHRSELDRHAHRRSHPGQTLDGIIVSRNTSATLIDNVIQDNGRDGIAIVDTAEATIRGGTITQNRRDGIRVGGWTILPGRSTAAIGLDDEALLELSQNGGAGLLVVDDGFDLRPDRQPPDRVRGQCRAAIWWATS